MVLALVLALVLAGCSPGVEGLDPHATARPAPVAASTTAAAPSTPPTPPATPSTPATPATPGEPGAPELLGSFDVGLAPEVSGIAASRREPDLLWLVDDATGTSQVIGVRHDGTTAAEVTVDGLDAVNLEDLAAGPCGAGDPSPCLYLADIGDNVAGREAIAIHRIGEPAPGDTTAVATTARYTYPSGPVDAEALVVGADGLPIVLTKEEGTTRVMAATAFADGALVQTGQMPVPQPSSPLLTGFVGLSVTGADASHDGSRVLLRTYDSVVELTAPSPGAPLSDLAAWTAAELPAAPEGQGEAVAYLPDGRSYVTASEGSGSLWAVSRS